ncbi:MAG: DUF1292 domain-containing protein [Caldicoprobacterales bacterium]|jgi:uncharacterized protein YrzB (UPF0473 family)|nr:DUF1292 domain-containing protein [Clostridiales bacterium]
MKETPLNVVELIDENDEIKLFEYRMPFYYDGREYMVLTPLEEETEEDGIVILRVEQDDKGDDYYTTIDDLDELEEVFDAVNQVFEQTLN